MVFLQGTEVLVAEAPCDHPLGEKPAARGVRTQVGRPSLAQVQR